MKALTAPLVLAPDAALDLQLHTTFSDGTWTPEHLIDYLVREQFGLVAITDHRGPERVHHRCDRSLPSFVMVVLTRALPYDERVDRSLGSCGNRC